MTLEYDRYIRTPFEVKATRITKENMQEVANLGIGRVETRKNERTGKNERCIVLDRRVVPNVPRAYVGWYVTVFDDNFKCYSAKVFREQFMDMPEKQPVSFDFSEVEHNPPVVEDVNTISEITLTPVIHTLALE